MTTTYPSDPERAPDRPQQLRRLTSAELSVLRELDDADRNLWSEHAAEGPQYSSAKLHAAKQRFARARLAANEIGFDIRGD